MVPTLFKFSIINAFVSCVKDPRLEGSEPDKLTLMSSKSYRSPVNDPKEFGIDPVTCCKFSMVNTPESIGIDPSDAGRVPDSWRLLR